MNYITLNGRRVSRSKNLRGILAYARTSPVRKVWVAPFAGQGLLRVKYENGAHSTITFADYAAMSQWVLSRKAWPQATLVEASFIQNQNNMAAALAYGRRVGLL